MYEEKDGPAQSWLAAKAESRRSPEYLFEIELNLKKPDA
jgi:hypothetical protein